METAVYSLRWTGELADQEALLALVPAARRERLPEGRPERWDQPLLAWGLLAWAAAVRWGMVPLPAVAVQGRPRFLDWPDRQFNLSHTAGAVACVLGEGPVGVDIEGPRPLSPRLLKLLGTADGEEALARWVCREAAAKRLGGPGSLRVPAAGEGDCRLFRLEGGYWLAVSAEGPVRHETVALDALLAFAERRAAERLR